MFTAGEGKWCLRKWRGCMDMEQMVVHLRCCRGWEKTKTHVFKSLEVALGEKIKKIEVCDEQKLRICR